MSKGKVYYWAPSEGQGYQDGIALLQSKPINTPLNLVVNTPGQPPVFGNMPTNISGFFSYINTLSPNTTTPGISANIIRNINIWSTNNNTNTHFVIYGIGCPRDNTTDNPTAIVGPISETILVGPNGTILDPGFVTSVNLYTIVYAIIPTNQNATNVYAGYGPDGITGYCVLDSNVNTIQGYGTSFSVQAIPAGFATITNTIYISMNKPEYPTSKGSLLPFGLINNNPIVFMPAFPYQVEGPDPNDTFFSYIYTGVQTIWSTQQGTTTDSLIFTVLQQGI